MGFHAEVSCTDGTCDRKSFAVRSLSRGSLDQMNEEFVSVDSLRISRHPAGALAELKPTACISFHSSPEDPAADGQQDAAKRLELLSLHDGLTGMRGGSNNSVPPSDASSCSSGTSYTSPIVHDHRASSPAPSVTSQASSPSASLPNTPRAQFLVFIKILFKCLDQANEPEIREKAKKIVAECTRRNRMGDPNFDPLMDAVQKRLRPCVGEALWRRSMLLLRHYMMSQAAKANTNVQRHEVPL